MTSQALAVKCHNGDQSTMLQNLDYKRKTFLFELLAKHCFMFDKNENMRIMNLTDLMTLSAKSSLILGESKTKTAFR